jgi:hypothetical protein
MRTLLLTLVLTACSSHGEFDPGIGNDTGDGTSTLFVDGSVTAEARLANAQTNADFSTDFSVRIQLNQQTVTTGAIVKVTSSTGEFLLTFGDEGRWVGRAPTYDEVYRLDVDLGPDNVHGVRVDGPDIHVFDKPLPGATVDSTMPLEIDWSRDDTAMLASIDTENLERVSITDTGDYTLAAGALKAERDQAKTNQIQLSRTDMVTPSGAIAGSQLSVRVRNEIEVVVQPNPAL